jgi:hypothetical protein
LIEHWDGATWSIVPSPAVFTEANELRNVAAIAPDDIWAVGYYCCVQGWTRPLVEHWDGTTWQVVPSPASGLKNNEFWDVAAFSAQDVWAVGGVMDDVHGVLHPLIEHWDGTTWQIVPSPDPPNPYGNYDTYLNGVAGSGPTDVWAVGSQWSGTLVEHWDGRRWTMFPAPSPGQVISFLYGVAVLSATNAWAVGEYSLSGGGGLALVLHWNGSCWALVPAPSPGAISNHLIRVAVSGTSDAWAVGHTWNGNGYPINTLAEHYVGPCPDPPGCPSPTPTATIPPSPTGTVTPTPPATATPSPSPTSTLCPIIFSDVDAGNPFYSYVRCLACHGLVGGYPCGGPGEPCGGSTNPPYFRPTANVTRGQLSKIIAGAAGFTDPIPSARQTFADVPPGSTFWPWIERLAARGAIGGYPCGGPFEPCAGPANRPYFRPNNPATRGQISKIVSEAAGYRETPTAQTFADVPPGDPFYAYVERLAARGIVSGYPCGGPFEPCVGPGNRPYFRPGHHTTRGQLAKIAILPFFPGCDPPAPRGGHPPTRQAPNRARRTARPVAWSPRPGLILPPARPGQDEGLRPATGRNAILLDERLE